MRPGYAVRPFVVDRPAAYSVGMTRPIHAFKIGQQVDHHSAGLSSRKRTGPYTIVGLVRQSSGAILFKIKSATHEQLAHESELKLVLRRKDVGE